MLLLTDIRKTTKTVVNTRRLSEWDVVNKFNTKFGFTSVWYISYPHNGYATFKVLHIVRYESMAC